MEGSKGCGGCRGGGREGTSSVQRRGRLTHSITLMGDPVADVLLKQERELEHLQMKFWRFREHRCKAGFGLGEQCWKMGLGERGGGCGGRVLLSDCFCFLEEV